MQGVLNLTVSIDNTQLSMPFRVADEVQYDCILGIDFKRAFKMKIDYENDTWWTPKGVVHQFYRYGQDPTCFPALASIGGLSRATADQQRIIEALKEKLIPPTPEKLRLANVAPHFIDIQGNEPIRLVPRKCTPKMLQTAWSEVDRMLDEGIIEPPIVPSEVAQY